MLLRTTALLSAIALLATPALAVTVKNTGDKEITIGIDRGSEEKVETVAAGKSLEIECKEQCGVTGPWGFSWLAKGDATFSTDGTSLINVADKLGSDKSASEGAGTGEAGANTPETLHAPTNRVGEQVPTMRSDENQPDADKSKTYQPGQR